MIPYADMTETERLQAVKRLAKFCGVNLIAYQGFLVRSVVSIHGEVSLQQTLDTRWNPFLDARHLEEVEAAIVSDGTRSLHIIRVKTSIWANCHEIEQPIIKTEGPTKADALHAVVVALGERKG